MGLSWLLVLLALSGGFAENSSRKQLLEDYYREIGCVARKENDSDHPTSFDCSELEKRTHDKCHYHGKTYDVGSDVTDLPPAACVAACKCLAHGGEKPSFNCARIECPEFFGVKPKPNCRYVYDPDHCCARQTVCEPKEETTCSYQNESYLKGQKFYPKDHPCKVCICMENFKGKIEAPFCSDVQCNVELHSLSRINDGCVPVYYGNDGCCPVDWKCPEGADSVRASKSPKVDTKTSKSCKFGALTLQPGDELQHSDEKIDCACKLPPYLTCILKPRS